MMPELVFFILHIIDLTLIMFYKRDESDKSIFNQHSNISSDSDSIKTDVAGKNVVN